MLDSMANYYRLKSVLTILTSVPLCLFLAKVKFNFIWSAVTAIKFAIEESMFEKISSKIYKDLLLRTISCVHQTFASVFSHLLLVRALWKENKQQLRMWTQCIYIQGSCSFCSACQVVQYKALLTSKAAQYYINRANSKHNERSWLHFSYLTANSF